ncbi:hypothetical protein [Paraburkholderia sp. EG304]|uniref:hypothetical protein n=1 Tax=Paraburkholderia sp. EG304 TaxID=3237015 RepID=UPI00397AFC11
MKPHSCLMPGAFVGVRVIVRHTVDGRMLREVRGFDATAVLARALDVSDSISLDAHPLVSRLERIRLNEHGYVIASGEGGRFK